MSRVPALISALSLLFTLSCATGADSYLNASKSVYPISLSQSIVDEGGRFYRPRKDEIVGHFERSWRSYDWLYGLVSINGSPNLGRIVGAEIKRRDGDAVVNLRVRSNYWKTWYVTSVLFFLPNSVGVTVEGDVVRRQPRSIGEPDLQGRLDAQ